MVAFVWQDLQPTLDRLQLRVNAAGDGQEKRRLREQMKEVLRGRNLERTGPRLPGDLFSFCWECHVCGKPTHLVAVEGSFDVDQSRYDERRWVNGCIVCGAWQFDEVTFRAIACASKVSEVAAWKMLREVELLAPLGTAP
jgi:hypothetical protein